jgi:replicative DNA helicase
MSVAAENIVGALLLRQADYWRVADSLRIEDFPADLRKLYSRIAQAANDGEAYDAVNAAEEGFDEAIRLASESFSSAYLETWAAQLVGATETRRVRDAGKRIALCETYGEAQDILAAVRPEQTEQIKTAKDGVSEMVETLQARFDAGGRITGVPTGVDSLDELTSGWQPGNLIVLVGETSMGKSTLALQFALAAARYAKERDEQVPYFSLEMTASELTERAVANLADFPLRWMTQPSTAPDNAMDYVQRGSRALLELPLLIDDRCALSLEQIVSRSTQLHMRKRLSAVVVDYMHIMARPRRNDVAELGAIATGLKNLSKNLGVPVIALHQLNRSNGSQGRDRRPTLFDIRASGEIAETANTVVAIYRSEVARPDFAPLKGYAEALILKQRQGRRDVRAWMHSKVGNMRFESCEAPSGYDETITKDHDESNGSAGNAGGSGSVTTRLRSRSQPSPFPRAGGDN